MCQHQPGAMTHDGRPGEDHGYVRQLLSERQPGSFAVLPYPERHGGLELSGERQDQRPSGIAKQQRARGAGHYGARLGAR